MAIDINKDVNLEADALEQVKGGGAVVSGKGKPTTATYDLAVGKKG